MKNIKNLLNVIFLIGLNGVFAMEGPNTGKHTVEPLTPGDIVTETPNGIPVGASDEIEEEEYDEEEDGSQEEGSQNSGTAKQKEGELSVHSKKDEDEDQEVDNTNAHNLEAHTITHPTGDSHQVVIEEPVTGAGATSPSPTVADEILLTHATETPKDDTHATSSEAENQNNGEASQPGGTPKQDAGESQPAEEESSSAVKKGAPASETEPNVGQTTAQGASTEDEMGGAGVGQTTAQGASTEDEMGGARVGHTTEEHQHPRDDTPVTPKKDEEKPVKMEDPESNEEGTLKALKEKELAAAQEAAAQEAAAQEEKFDGKPGQSQPTSPTPLQGKGDKGSGPLNNTTANAGGAGQDHQSNPQPKVEDLLPPVQEPAENTSGPLGMDTSANPGGVDQGQHQTIPQSAIPGDNTSTSTNPNATGGAGPNQTQPNPQPQPQPQPQAQGTTDNTSANPLGIDKVKDIAPTPSPEEKESLTDIKNQENQPKKLKIANDKKNSTGIGFVKDNFGKIALGSSVAAALRLLLKNIQKKKNKNNQTKIQNNQIKK